MFLPLFRFSWCILYLILCFTFCRVQERQLRLSSPPPVVPSVRTSASNQTTPPPHHPHTRLLPAARRSNVGLQPAARRLETDDVMMDDFVLQQVPTCCVAHDMRHCAVAVLASVLLAADFGHHYILYYNSI